MSFLFSNPTGLGADPSSFFSDLGSIILQGPRSRDIFADKKTARNLVLTECLDLLENDDNNGDDNHAVVAGAPAAAGNNPSANSSSNMQNLGRPPPWFCLGCDSAFLTNYYDAYRAIEANVVDTYTRDSSKNLFVSMACLACFSCSLLPPSVSLKKYMWGRQCLSVLGIGRWRDVWNPNGNRDLRSAKRNTIDTASYEGSKEKFLHLSKCTTMNGVGDPDGLLRPPSQLHQTISTNDIIPPACSQSVSQI